MFLSAFFAHALTAAPAPAQRSTEFVPVQGGGNATSAQTLLVIAYLVMWALLVLFIYFSWRRQQRIEARVGHLEKALAKGGSGSQDSRESSSQELPANS